MRHVWHHSEGLDTFTGSVGLKPTDGGAVFWLKVFSTTPDEMPREAYDFAVALLTGFTFLVQSKTLPETDQAARTVGMPRRPGDGSSLT